MNSPSDPLSGCDLDGHLARLERWLEGEVGLQGWSQVVFIERGATSAERPDVAADRVALASFRARWVAIAQEATGWVNLVAVSIESGTLTVAVEWKTDGSRHDADRVAVTHSCEIRADGTQLQR